MNEVLRISRPVLWLALVAAGALFAVLPVDGCDSDAGSARVDAAAGAEDSGRAPVCDVPDVTGDSGDSRNSGDSEEDAVAGGDVLPARPDPAALGPYAVGVAELPLYDPIRDRDVRTVVWYPATPEGQKTAVYLLFVEGSAYVNPPADRSAAPYPLVLFSHGFNGIAEQSITFTEHLASHGYVVAAMDHAGNTIADADAGDAEVAAVALERPVDLRFVYEELVATSAEPGQLLSGLVDPAAVAVAGHSFGGYTALVVAGGTVDVDTAWATCEGGTLADIFCPYIPYWPQGDVVRLDPPLPHLAAAVAICPGGSAAFGPTGLAGVSVPTLVIGGSRDETTPVDIEIHPIFEALPAPKAEAVIADAAHLSFTNICDIPIAAAVLDDFCGVEGMRGAGETFPILDALVLAFLDRHLRQDDTYGWVLDQDALEERFGGVSWTAIGH